MKKTYPLILPAVCFVTSAFAADGTWDTAGTSSWDTATNWAGEVIASGQDSTATFQWDGPNTESATVSVDSDREIGHLYFFGTGGSGTHNITLEGASTLTLQNTSDVPTIISEMASRTATINTTLAGSNGLAIDSSGSSGVVLGGDNTYTGLTNIVAGTVRVTSNTAFGANKVSNSSDQVNVDNAGSIVLANGVNISEDLTITGFANRSALGVDSGSSAEWSGDITMQGGSRIGTTGASTVLTLSGDLLGSAGFTVNYGGDSDVQGTVLVTGAGNTYTGATTIFRGTLQLGGGNDRLPTGTTVQLGQVSTDSSLDLNGTDQSLVGIYNQTSGTSVRTITNTDSGNASVLTLTGSTDRSFMSGASNDTIISGNLSIVQNGNSNFTLGESNLFTGDVTVNAGTVTLADGAAMTIYIGNDGENNGFLGTGNLALNGILAFDLTGADDAAGNSWTIIGSGLSETYGGTFAIQDFTEGTAGVWSFGDYVYTEATGVLSVVPEPSTYTAILGGFCFLFMLVRRRK